MQLIWESFSSDRIVSAELRGGYGLFAGRVPNVWIASPFANSGVVQYGSRTGRFGVFQYVKQVLKELVLKLLKLFIKIFHILNLQAQVQLKV